jgi:hypothetical protein
MLTRSEQKVQIKEVFSSTIAHKGEIDHEKYRATGFSILGARGLRAGPFGGHRR